MTKKSVGSKSLNLALLQPKLPKDILTPQAVALPYGCMQKALTDPINNESVLKVAPPPPTPRTPFTHAQADNASVSRA